MSIAETQPDYLKVLLERAKRSEQRERLDKITSDWKFMQRHLNIHEENYRIYSSARKTRLSQEIHAVLPRIQLAIDTVDRAHTATYTSPSATTKQQIDADNYFHNSCIRATEKLQTLQRVLSDYYQIEAPLRLG